MFQKVVVANRGAIAGRILRALTTMGIKSVAVYSDADASAPWLDMADETVRLGAGPPRDSYLNVQALVAAVKKTGADGLHPGYGFLAENYKFAQLVQDTGVGFIGPSPKWIDAMGHKTRAREFAVSHGLPVGRGSEVLSGNLVMMKAAAEKIGYPVLAKPAGGGGGIGMVEVRGPDELEVAVERASSLAQRGFANPEVYLERLVERPRHVEVQVMGDRAGNLCHLFERDCSVQRRHQKIIEESPAPNIERATVDAVSNRIASKLGEAGYDNIGTVEMLMDPTGDFSFLEMNTRLQVEHGVTEEVTGVDLVIAQIRAAAGDTLGQIFPNPLKIDGHSIQARVYAEDPKRFFPSPGTLSLFRPPQNGVRIETGYREGQEVTPFYDPLLAKVIVHAPTRQAAILKLCEALRGFEIGGVKHNIPALLWILESDEFRAGAVHTGLVAQVLARHP